MKISHFAKIERGNLHMKNIVNYEVKNAFPAIDGKALKEGEVLLFYKKSPQTAYGQTSDCWGAELMIFQGYGNADKSYLIFEGTASGDHGMNLDVFGSECCVKLNKDQHPPVVKDGMRYVFAV
jgi:hypothetical protein